MNLQILGPNVIAFTAFSENFFQGGRCENCIEGFKKVADMRRKRSYNLSEMLNSRDDTDVNKDILDIRGIIQIIVWKF